MSSAADNPAPERAPGRPALRARPSATSHATVTVTGPSPPQTGRTTAWERRRCHRHSGFRQPCTLNGRRASLDGWASAGWRQPRSPPDNPGHRTLNTAPPPLSARSWRHRRCRHEAADPAPRGQPVAAPAAEGPAPERGTAARELDPAAIPHRQLFRTPLRIPADTGTPRTRGMRRQCPE